MPHRPTREGPHMPNATASESSVLPGGTGDAASERSATLTYPGGEHRMKIVRASGGADGIGLGALLATSGLVTLDPGFVNTAACSSEICFIDGDAGILRYRGYPIEQLAEHSTFLEVSYLLIYGNLPTPEELSAFDGRIR